MTKSILKNLGRVYRKIKRKNIFGNMILILVITLTLFIIVNLIYNENSPVATILDIKITPTIYKAGLKTLNIGDKYGGGIIFYIDSTGQHGLIAATIDQGLALWGSPEYTITGARATAVGTGAANTTKIISVQGQQLKYAALLCAKYNGGGYTGWFLPSRDELYLLQLKKSVVGGFTRGYYWSSSEFDQTLTWTKFFYNNDLVCSHKDLFFGVRAIRAF